MTLGVPSQDARKTRLMRRVERRQGGEIPKLLLDLLRQGKTYAEIGKLWRVSRPTVGKWAKDYGVDLRSLARRGAEAEQGPQEQAS